MAYIHLEDGSSSLFWVMVWWIIALVLIGAALWFLRSGSRKNQNTITIAAFVTAAAFVISQIEIPLAGGVHLNLTPLIGILAGPILGAFFVLTSISSPRQSVTGGGG
jgi:cobalt/nickel transport system permease protein